VAALRGLADITMPLRKLISGGQTGVDRAPLDVAIRLSIPHGGWCPAGRWAEDGPIDARYRLAETPSPDPAERTAWNVRDANATLILTLGPPTGGADLTRRLALEAKHPLLILDLAATPAPEAAHAISAWLAATPIECLNIAGPRASEAEGVYARAFAVLKAAFHTSHKLD
jgi:hypothetical protein